MSTQIALEHDMSEQESLKPTISQVGISRIYHRQRAERKVGKRLIAPTGRGKAARKLKRKLAQESDQLLSKNVDISCTARGQTARATPRIWTTFVEHGDHIPWESNGKDTESQPRRCAATRVYISWESKGKGHERRQ